MFKLCHMCLHMYIDTLTHYHEVSVLFKVGLGVRYSVMASVQLTPADRVGAVLMCLGGPAARLSSHTERGRKYHQL